MWGWGYVLLSPFARALFVERKMLTLHWRYSQWDPITLLSQLQRSGRRVYEAVMMSIFGRSIC